LIHEAEQVNRERLEGTCIGSVPGRPSAWIELRCLLSQVLVVDVARDLAELRHSYVSLMHDAGFSLERIGDYVGHSSAYMTDAYRHLIEGHEAEAAERFEAYLNVAAESTAM
jgi:hypothetical protein